MIFTLKIRKPIWAKSVQTNEKYHIENNYLVIQRKFAKDDKIELNFTADVQVREDLNHENYFSYGALIFAKPISATEHKGRVYAIGFEDLTYQPTENTRYEFIENCKTDYKNGEILVNLKNKTTNIAKKNNPNSF